MPTLWKLTLTALATALIAPAAAGAATTIGQSPPAGGVSGGPCGNAGAADFIQVANATGTPYKVPAGGGVITSWQTSTTGPAQLRLRVFDAGSPMTPVAESDLETVPSSESSFPTRIAVSGGETIGLLVAGGGSPAGCYNVSSPTAADVATVSVPVPIGMPEPTSLGAGNVLINVAATLEPDADKDGYGDETQDGCPTDAATHLQCPSPPIDNAFTIGKRKLNKRKGTAKLTVTVPAAGVLQLTGKSVARSRVEKAAAGNAKLTLRPKGKLKRRLSEKGRAKVKATISFTPTGGETATQEIKVKLRQRR